ncbi:hypothetical protein K438DRAFT_1981679 [Mycena galopus ATCC 62051]|nr:hypothetical protein K438DRAFT_1981679 [Mycena galopus ATCC 62051]
MSSSLVAYYQEELNDLLRLLKNLPDTIPIGDHHNFIGYAPESRWEGRRRKGLLQDIIITFNDLD